MLLFLNLVSRDSKNCEKEKSRPKAANVQSPTKAGAYSNYPVIIPRYRILSHSQWSLKTLGAGFVLPFE
jgi:hypothetical protein